MGGPGITSYKGQNLVAGPAGQQVLREGRAHAQGQSSWALAGATRPKRRCRAVGGQEGRRVCVSGNGQSSREIRLRRAVRPGKGQELSRTPLRSTETVEGYQGQWDVR